MLFLLPAAFIVLLFVFYSKKLSLFDSGVSVIITMSLLVVFINNVLSVFHALTTISLAVFWGFVLLIAVFIAIRNNGFQNVKVQQLKRIAFLRQKSVLFYIFLALTLISLFYARAIVPNNWDSMTYHLARVAHWVNNKSVNYYFTLNIRQLVSPVLDEYVLLHVVLLAGNDKYVNLMQWFSYIVSAICIYKIVKSLGCHSVFAYIAMYLFMTMPIAFAESMTTQNDLFATMYLMLFVYKAIGIAKKDTLEFTRGNVCAVATLGLLLGLGYLAKTSVCLPMVYCAACLVVYLFCTKKLRAKDCGIYLVCAFLCFAVVACETFIRWKYYGSIDTSIVNARILVGTKNPLKLLVNLYKNMAILLVVIQPSGKILRAAARMLCHILGVDMNDTAISFGGHDFSPAFSFHMDGAGAAIVTALGVIAFFYFLFNKNAGKQKRILAAIIFMGFLTIPAVLRWQPWGTRIMLPCASLLCVLVALFLDDFGLRHNIRQGVSASVITTCLLTYVPQIAWHRSAVYAALKKNTERFSLYFYNRQNIYPAYLGLIRYCEELGTESIALCAGGDSYVYPFLAYFKTKHDMSINESPLWDGEPLDNNSDAPKYIACVDMDNGQRFMMKDFSYEKVYSVDDYSVYKREDM